MRAPACTNCLTWSVCRLADFPIPCKKSGVGRPGTSHAMHPGMKSGWHRLAVFGALMALPACAASHPIPTELMAKTAMELHAAEAQGARHSAEGARLCQHAEEALEQSRRQVFRGRNQDAQATAERGYSFARQARELGEVESRARVAQLRRANDRAAPAQAAAPALGMSALTAAEVLAAPSVP
jgi:hypothetical protein